MTITIHALFQDALLQENVQRVKQQLKATHGVSKEGRILMKEVLP